MGPIETASKNASAFINGWLFQHAVMLLVQESKDLDKLQGSLFRARETFTDWKDIASDVLKQKREICLLYTYPSTRARGCSRMKTSA